jgi:hypothetical protein
MKIGCWPIASAAKRHTISELVKKLSLFDYTSTATTCESGVCRHDFKKCVELAIARANDAFEGLCLDCMQRSTLVTGQDIETFTEKTTPYNFFWDADCRFGHGRASWCYSWTGPPCFRQGILDKYRKARRQSGASKPKKAVRLRQEGDMHKLVLEDVDTNHNSDFDEEDGEFYDAEETYLNSEVAKGVTM